MQLMKTAIRYKSMLNHLREIDDQRGLDTNAGICHSPNEIRRTILRKLSVRIRKERDPAACR